MTPPTDENLVADVVGRILRREMSDDLVRIIAAAIDATEEDDADPA
jgi:hypothetical protein